MVGKDFDVLVVGGGASGLISAIYLAKKGLNVGLIKKASGATQMTSGLFDVLGYMNDELVFNPIEGIKRLTKEKMGHPYSIVGEENVIEELKEATSFFKKIVAEANYSYEGELSKNILTITPLGTYKPTCLAPKWMYLNVLGFRKSKLLFVGVRNYVGVNPVYVARSFNSFLLPSLVKIDKEVEAQAEATYMYVPGLEEGAATSFDVGIALDDQENLKEFASRLSKDAKGVDFLFLPALGYKKPMENQRYLKDELGTEVIELPSVVPSIAGRRLTLALEDAAVKSGVKVHDACKGLSAIRSNGECTAIRASYGGSEIEMEASAFILATGSYIAEGLVMEKNGVKEPLFEIPISTPPNETYSEWAKKEPFPSAGHPSSFFGVNVDKTMRPLSNQKVFCDNLFACGSILAGYDYATEKSGLGVCAVTALIAAKEAGEYIK
jgi:glycerol-3-phosphate dehydrogenase subunit B